MDQPSPIDTKPSNYSIYSKAETSPVLRNSFLKTLETNPYQEIIEAHQDPINIEFKLQIAGQVYSARISLTKEYLENRSFEKPKLDDLTSVKFYTQSGNQDLSFNLNPPETKSLETLLEKVLLLINFSGGSSGGKEDINPKPYKPPSDYSHESRERTRQKAQTIHFALGA